MSNVLLTCVGRRNYLADYFREVLNGSGFVVGADMNTTAPGLVDCDKKHIVPSVYDDAYVDRLLSICADEKIKLVVGLNDLELPVLAINKDRFAQIGVTVAVSDTDVIARCADKLKAHQWLLENDFPTPATFTDIADVLKAIDAKEIVFPCVVKPRWGSGSIGVFEVHDVAELKAAHALALSGVRRGMLATASAEDLEHSVLVQEMCTGDEYGCDILNDFDGGVRTVVMKQKLGMRAGETDKAIVRQNPELRAFCERLGKKSGHVGNLDCDIFVSGSSFQVLEMNPRFGGGYPFSHVAGAQFPKALLCWSAGQAFDADKIELVYDEVYSKFDTMRKVTGS